MQGTANAQPALAPRLGFCAQLLLTSMALTRESYSAGKVSRMR